MSSGEPNRKLLFDRYKEGRLLGAGSFGRVVHAWDIKSGDEVAIKILNKAILGKEKMKKEVLEKQIMHEIVNMRRLRHPNVVRLHDVMATRKRIFLVMEYVRGGTLYNHILRRNFTEDEARRLFQQLVSAIAYCHAAGVYHRDIKPENLLLDEHGNIKVTDFGLSAVADTENRKALFYTFCGTPPYMAPELFARKGYDGAKADAWACGVILFFLVSGRKPARCNNIQMLYNNIHGEYRSSRSDLDRLLHNLLRPNPKHRMTIPEIMENRWFKRGFKEINFYINDDDPSMSDSDSDIFVPMQSSTLSSLVSSSVTRSPCGMRTSSSAPSLTEVMRTDNALVQPPLQRAKSLNAFDIIASSQSFNLSNLFEERGEQMQFVSSAPVPKIISKLQEIAEQASFKVRAREHQVTFEDRRHGQMGALVISAKIFELSSELVMIQVCKKAGGIPEYMKFCHNELKPGLRDIVDE